MKLTLLSASAAGLAALAACAPAPGDAPDTPRDGGQTPGQGEQAMQPDLSWVEPNLDWFAVTAETSPPVRLLFGAEASDHIMISLTCGAAAGTFDVAYFESAPENNGMTTELAIKGEDGALTLDAEAKCPYSRLHQGCVTTATTSRTGELTDLVTSTTPLRISAAGEAKWYPAPGAKGEKFVSACRD